MHVNRKHLGIPMLIEAICKYNVGLGNEAGSIEALRFVDLGTPLTDKDYIVNRGCAIAVFGSQILSFRVSEPVPHERFGKTDSTSVNGAVPKVFSFECITVDKPESKDTGPNDADRDYRTKNTWPRGRKVVKEFESVYPTTDIYCTDNNLVFVLEQPSKTVKQVMSELRKMHPSLSMKDGRYFTGSPGGGSTQYVIKGADGQILVDISALKRENVRGFYHNDNRSCVCLINRGTQKIRTASTCNDNFTANAADLDLEESACSVAMDSTEEPETVFEFSRSKEYVVLIKVFLKNLRRSKYSFVKHFWIQSIDTFCFIAFKVRHTVTLVMSRRLYDYTKLVNLLHSPGDGFLVPDTGFLDMPYSKGMENLCQVDPKVYGFCVRCLSIPDLGPEGSLSITYMGESLNKRYTVKEISVGCTQAFRSLFECDGVVLEENESSFWDIQSINNRLDPLKFPGLIISPLSDEMKYLLEGPYPFLVSSGEWVEPANKFVRVFKVPQSKQNREIGEPLDTCLGCEDSGVLCRELHGYKLCSKDYALSGPSHCNAAGHNHRKKQSSGSMRVKSSLKNARFIRSLKDTIKGLMGTNKKASTTSRVDLFLKDKEKFISSVISTKLCYFLPSEMCARSSCFKVRDFDMLSQGALPTSFDAPSLIEKYFINEIKPFSCMYAFDLSGEMEFFPQAKVNARDALSLWMMIYPGEVDYEPLLKASDCDVLYLARRACIDRNVKVVQKILRQVIQSDDTLAPWAVKGPHRSTKKLPGSGKWARCNAKRFSRSSSLLARSYMLTRSNGKSKASRRLTRLDDVLSVIGNYDKWDLHEINSRLSLSTPYKDTCGNFIVTVAEHPSYVRVGYRGNMYNLMTLENILGCIYNEFYDDRLRASILAHFQEANLPVSPPRYMDTGDFTIAL